jgi:hypothetical protein
MTLYNGSSTTCGALYPKYGYQEVMTPQLFRAELFKTSGHYEKFHDDMFWFEGDEGEELGVKAMNCPGHCRLYLSAKRSYRELPLRFAEFSRLHRNERSGTLTGCRACAPWRRTTPTSSARRARARRDRALLRDDRGGLPRPRPRRTARCPSRRGRSASSAIPRTGTAPSAR